MEPHILIENLESHIEKLKLRTQSMETRMLKIRDDHPELAAGLSRGINKINKLIAETQLVLDNLKQMEERNENQRLT